LGRILTGFSLGSHFQSGRSPEVVIVDPFLFPQLLSSFVSYCPKFFSPPPFYEKDGTTTTEGTPPFPFVVDETPPFHLPHGGVEPLAFFFPTTYSLSATGSFFPSSFFWDWELVSLWRVRMKLSFFEEDLPFAEGYLPNAFPLAKNHF